MLFSMALINLSLGNTKAFGQANAAAKELQNCFINIAKTLKPSVVNIRVERNDNQTSIKWLDPYNNSPDESPFDDLFKKFFKQSPNQKKHGKPSPIPKGPQYKSEAAGSGVIFDTKGTILTNNHVVKGASKITVKLSDGREFQAKVVGKDPQSDLAIVKIEATTPLQPAKFANSDNVQVGEWCMAIGNPMGLEQTITVGVVSAVGRSGLGASPIEDFIQTDAGINPGNSGGPLVDLEGNVIGINTLIFAAPGAGIGFAIPSSMANRVATQIVSQGSVERPYIGITMQGITAELAEHFSLKDKNGAVVMELSPEAPAAKAGLQQMDIIRSVDGQNMVSTSDVQKFVLGKKIGDIIQVKILRNGSEKVIPIKLEKMPKTFGLNDPEDLIEEKQPEKEIASNKKLGFSYQQLTPELAKSLDLEKKKGLLVSEIEENSSAEKGGLQVQDLITQVNGQQITDEASLLSAIKSGESSKKSAVFVVIREGSPMFLVIPNE